MTIPFWCLLAAVLLPYVWVPFTAEDRAKAEGGFDNFNPRAQQAKLSGRAARAIAAHKNSFEALAAFAPAVVVNHIVGADATQSAAVAVAWVVLRVLYGVLYLSNAGNPRSVVWFLSLACSLALFGLAAMK
ncbi:MAG: MAPEG family protein [Deltaproteobacteria bacterium]|nr:MAPEG family protein [Deltaproteobacteria bacterium]